MPFYYPQSQITLEKRIIVIPVVSAGNVAQLAADLLITTLSLPRIGVFDPAFCIPVIGSREDGKEGVTLPLELYGRPDSPLVIVQQRSPVLKSHKQDFIGALLDFIKQSNFAGAVFLTGVNSSNRTDSQMWTSIFHLYPSNLPPLESTPFRELAKLPIPQYTSQAPEKPYGSTSKTPSEVPSIPGGGLTHRTIASLPKEWNIPTLFILQFVMEGDNRGDAHVLASAFAKVVALPDSQWKHPSSWDEGLFGAPHDQSLYG